MRITLFFLATFVATNLVVAIPVDVTQKHEELNQVSAIKKIECILDQSIKAFNLEIDNNSYEFSHQNIEENTNIIISENKKLPTKETIIGTASEIEVGTTYNSLINKHIEPNKKYKLTLTVKNVGKAGYQILYNLEEI